VYDFQSISVGQLSLDPPVARHNVEIELNGHPIRLHPQPLEQPTQRNGPIDLMIVTIDYDFHVP
jgi:hypothetical protein